MATRNTHFLLILFFNLLGFALFLSWYLPENHGFWFPIDKSIFYYFNQHIASNPTFLKVVVILNNRAFDVVALLAMCALFYTFFRKEDKQGKYRLICMGILMLITAVALNQLGRLIPFDRPSPTLSFDNVVRASRLSGIPTKDSSTSSFPGDHGLMLLIFAGFIWRYFGSKAFLIALTIMALFSLPRIMIGSHWFTDVYIGSVFIASVGLSWLLLTPASDYLINKLVSFIPKRYYS